ncbi:MAG: zinc-finger domain-containing protein [Rudaea sp.]
MRGILPEPVTVPGASCAERVLDVQWGDLPLACPLPGTELWNAHPRIYLPIHRSGREACPYCGTIYRLRAPRAGEPVPPFANIEIERCYWDLRRQVESALDAESSTAGTPA